MARVSQAQARENRERVIDVAAELFRERGVQGVSVADVMAAAGLTHGGFYKQFASKDGLVAEATGRAFADHGAQLGDLARRHPGDHVGARRELLDSYLSPAHRDAAGQGCPVTALGGDMTREAPRSPAREAYAEGVERFARFLAGVTDESLADGPGEARPVGPDEELAMLATMVGALMLSRATAGTELSDRILAAARRSLDA